MVIRGHSTRVGVARVHGAEAEPAADRDRHQAPGDRAVTNLAEIAVAPAVGPVPRSHPAGMGGASAHPPEAEPRAGDNDRRQAVGGRAIADLALGVPSPAVDPVRRGYGAGMGTTRIHLAEEAPARDRDRP